MQPNSARWHCNQTDLRLPQQPQLDHPDCAAHCRMCQACIGAKETQHPCTCGSCRPYCHPCWTGRPCSRVQEPTGPTTAIQPPQGHQYTMPGIN